MTSHYGSPVIIKRRIEKRDIVRDINKVKLNK